MDASNVFQGIQIGQHLHSSPREREEERVINYTTSDIEWEVPVDGHEVGRVLDNDTLGCGSILSRQGSS